MTVVQAFASSGNRCDGPQSAPFAALAGSLLARKSIITQHDAGVSLDQIREHQHDLAAWLFSRVRTPTGEAFSRGYAEAADSILADLAEQQARPRRPRGPWLLCAPRRSSCCHWKDRPRYPSGFAWWPGVLDAGRVHCCAWP